MFIIFGYTNQINSVGYTKFIEYFLSNIKLSYTTINKNKMWGEIRREARTNPTLQDALERAIMIYKLTKTE